MPPDCKARAHVPIGRAGKPEEIASNYSDAWTATEHLRVSRGMMMAHVDPEKMVAAREAGASSWELHERAVRGEFAPEKPYNPGVNW